MVLHCPGIFDGWDGMIRHTCGGEKSSMTTFQEVVHRLLRDCGIFLLEDVPSSGEVLHPTDQCKSDESGTSWPTAHAG